MWARIWILALLVAICTGCRTPERAEYRSVVQLACDNSRDHGADPVWEATQAVLRSHNFTLDRVDRRAGLITTLPETSQHFFEVWRRDVRSWRDYLEASLNPVRRWVEISLTPLPETRGQELAVLVHKERLSSPDRQFNTSGAAYQFFAGGLPSTTGIPEVTAAHERWIGGGRDPILEDYLLQLILERASLEAPPAGAPEAEEPPPA